MAQEHACSFPRQGVLHAGNKQDVDGTCIMLQWAKTTPSVPMRPRMFDLHAIRLPSRDTRHLMVIWVVGMLLPKIEARASASAA